MVANVKNVRITRKLKLELVGSNSKLRHAHPILAMTFQCFSEMVYVRGVQPIQELIL